MGERSAVIIVVLFCLCILVSTSGIAFAYSNNWVEVVRFEGSEEIQTEPVTCNYVEWRIRWNYSPVFRMHTRSLGVFAINVFENEPKILVSSFGRVPTIESENGTFYLQIHALNIYKYSIIIEQNIDSIPEFPSWMILPVLIVSTLVVMIVRNKLRKKGLE